MPGKMLENFGPGNWSKRSLTVLEFSFFVNVLVDVRWLSIHSNGASSVRLFLPLLHLMLNSTVACSRSQCIYCFSAVLLSKITVLLLSKILTNLQNTFG